MEILSAIVASSHGARSLSEGPAPFGDGISYVDIYGPWRNGSWHGQVRSYDLKRNAERLILEADSCVGMAAPLSASELLVAEEARGICRWRLDQKTGVWSRVVSLAHPLTGQPGSWRYNDGKLAPSGHLFVGGMLKNPEDRVDPATGQFTNQAKLFRVNADGQCSAVLEGLNIPNGLGWQRAPSGAWYMYYIETFALQLWRFPFDSVTGDLDVARREVLYTFNPTSEGYPDGLCLSEDGAVIVACFNAHAEVRDGKALVLEATEPQKSWQIRAVIRVPGARQVTSACMVPGQSVLYLTTGAETTEPSAPTETQRYELLLEKSPASGSIFRADLSALRMIGQRNHFGFGQLYQTTGSGEVS